MSPILSILIPTFNSAFTIEETLNKVLQIPLKNIEVIISDHTSSDNTFEIVNAYKNNRIITRIEPRSSTVSHHWTNLSALATGKYIKLICADDLIEPISVIKQIEKLESDLSLAMVACKRSVINHSGKNLFNNYGLKNLIGSLSGTEAIRKSLLSGTNQFGEPACVTFRNSIFQKCLPWSAANPYVIDLEMYCDVLSFGNFFGFSETGATFRVTQNSWSSQLSKYQVKQFINLVERANSDLNLGLSSRELKLIRIKSFILSFLRSVFQKLTH